MRGENTIVKPSLQSAGIWKQIDFPAPVGMIPITSIFIILLSSVYFLFTILITIMTIINNKFNITRQAVEQSIKNIAKNDKEIKKTRRRIVKTEKEIQLL